MQDLWPVPQSILSNPSIWRTVFVSMCIEDFDGDDDDDDVVKHTELRNIDWGWDARLVTHTTIDYCR